LSSRKFADLLQVYYRFIQEILMKIQKIGFLLIMITMIASIIQANPTQAQGEVNTSTFGLNIKNSASVTTVDDGLDEPKNYWVHKNGLLWSEVQKDGPVSNWNSPHVTQLDAYLETMHEAGMEVILTIRSTPYWARRNDQSCGPMEIDYIDEFAQFVGEAVNRYKNELGYVTYFEIWNEPDAPFEYFENIPSSPYGCWGDPYDPSGFFGGGYYGQMLQQVYPALKKASPDAQLVIGGLLLPADPEDPFWSTWMGDRDWVYSDMSKFFEGILQITTDGTLDAPYFNFVNFHAYTYYGLNMSAIELERDTFDNFWDNRGGQVEGKLAYLESLMVKYSINKPVILTEAALLGDNIVDYDPTFEATKADYLVWLYTRNLAKGIYATTWYHLDNYGWRRSGLLDKNNNPLPAYDSFTVLTDMLDGAVYQDKTPFLGEGILGFEFSSDTNYWVLFSEDGQTKQIHRDQLPEWYYSVVDLFGNKINFQNDIIYFNRPIYIKENTAPVAIDDFYILNEGAPLTVTAPGVMRNDIDYDKDGFSTIVTQPTYGDVVLNSDGSFAYTPNLLTFTGTDSFTYQVSDGTFTSNTATVTIIDGTWLFLPLIHR